MLRRRAGRWDRPFMRTIRSAMRQCPRGVRARVTSPPWLTFAPAWSTDGRELTYFSWHGRSAGGVYRRESDGTGTEERVYESQRGASVVIRDVSVDGRWLSFDSGDVMSTLSL